ncbi:hypothetical protein KBC31_04795 [Candidatus Saccharibacteria bacterium]|nr:hypothetical protein [Candidatus Saccharibacteria bacterium]
METEDSTELWLLGNADDADVKVLRNKFAIEAGLPDLTEFNINPEELRELEFHRRINEAQRLAAGSFFPPPGMPQIVGPLDRERPPHKDRFPLIVRRQIFGRTVVDFANRIKQPKKKDFFEYEGAQSVTLEAGDYVSFRGGRFRGIPVGMNHLPVEHHFQYDDSKESMGISCLYSGEGLGLAMQAAIAYRSLRYLSQVNQLAAIKRES